MTSNNGLMDIVEVTRNVFGSLEKVCAECGKVFIVPSTVEAYVYQIRGDKSPVEFYCSYTHFRLGEKRKEQQSKDRVEAYCERLRSNKNKNNQRRRDKKVERV